MLGAMLFKGDHVPRQAARGLMWLTLARDSGARPDQAWITELYDSAIKQATDDERALALVYLERWLATGAGTERHGRSIASHGLQSGASRAFSACR